MPRHRSNFAAFTLIELVLVLALIAMIVGMTTASLGRFGRGRTIGDSAEQVVLLARWARTQAISRGINFRLNFDASNHSYWLTMQSGPNYENVVQDAASAAAPSSSAPTSAMQPQANSFTDVGEEFGRRFTTADTVTFDCNFAAQSDGQYVEFRPSGRCDPATVKFSEIRGTAVIEVGCLSATEQWHVLSDDERQLENSQPPPPSAQVR